MKNILALAAIAAVFTSCSHFQITRIEPLAGKGFAVSYGAGLCSLAQADKEQAIYEEINGANKK